MTARRQASTTSLAQFARAVSPELGDKSLDFCNAFWGTGDGGVDVLFARMRGATRTMEELRNFWKERALIEEQYAKRLAGLAKFTLGRDEIGDLRTSLDTLRLETEKQSGFHLMVAQQIKNDLEGQATTFLSKQQQHKKTYQALIEKEFKNKQTQESYVTKAREKYESDCMRINSLTAESTLMQGKDLENIQKKLDRVQQTVQANERDFANFARALQDNVRKWEMSWKAFCDSCQDMEEERLEFMKDNVWAYANSVSTVCVADDQSCEAIRLSLEQVEPERDMQNFVREYGTGNDIPDPPGFVNYANPNAIPSASQPPSTRPANFARTSGRPRETAPSPPPPDDDQEPSTNLAGVGLGIARQADAAADAQARSASRASYRNGNGPEVPPVNGHAPPQAAPVSRSQQPPAGGMRPADSQADVIDPTAKTMIKIGDNAYDVDLSRDPQAQTGRGSAQNGNAVVTPIKVGQEDDPLARQMAELKRAAPARGMSVRRSGNWQNAAPQAPSPTAGGQHGVSSLTKRDSTTKLSPPPGGSENRGRPPSRDYRHSADIVVGAYPIPSSRPASPNPPTAKYMMPPPQTPAGPGANLPVQEILADYQQSFPGERKSLSRPPSQAGHASGMPGHSPRPSQSSVHRERPLSMGGQAGVGAQGRSVSPQPYAPVSRSTSPAALHHAPAAPAPNSSVSSRNSYSSRVTPPSVNGTNGQTHNHSLSRNSVRRNSTSNSIRQNSMSVPQPVAQQQRATSPGPGGAPMRQNSMTVPQTGAQRQGAPSPGPNRHSSMSVPQAAPHQQRPTSPNSVGIALDLNGRVVTDSMADMYAQRQQQQQQQQQQQTQYGQPPPQNQPPPQQQHSVARRPTYTVNSNGYPQQTMPPQAPTQYPPTPVSTYSQQYGVQQPQQAPPPQRMYGAPPPAQYQQPQVYQPQPHEYTRQGAVVQNLHRGASMNGYYEQGGYAQPQQQQQQQQQQPFAYRAPSPARAPSPQPPPLPTGFTEDGRPVLFYVKALYDYQATIDEEFDFQSGDVIAVTATPEDGWWSGELLDEARRQPGRHVFPSNFVCLF
ncbi:uncharacterized protein LAESUDRAFT_813521 [Laetiporus sulphureus 93-53]|uniref:SH3 domain-containing protein n=1 Tax=Laetiporus sulphureus 93-53 TaxID=1314785 RepID=A0A165DQJ7_9APHY|nr:uncharacterized protein LAESUDRAFT_813521 [Laetiporus sulphureus 93-53]KZT05408.1 hypothetical protein LAESUDRAFT_813521 [Laetiporus sulphureus 93-53]